MSEKANELLQLRRISTRTNSLLDNLIKSNKELNSNIHSRLGSVILLLFLIWATMLFFVI